MHRIHRREDARLRRDPRHADGRDADEPHQRDRPEERAHPRRAAPLDQEQRDEDHDRRRHDVVHQPGRGDLEPLHRAQDRDGRRDDTVAVEERRAEEPDRDERRCPPDRGSEQRHEGEYPALAAIVRLHDEAEVLEHDHDQERPQHEREDAEHVGGHWRQPTVRREALLDGVKRRGPDVAVHDPQRRERQGGDWWSVYVRVARRRGVGGERVSGVHPATGSVLDP